MERRLFQAFDRQRFQQNERLAGVAEPIKEETLLIPFGMQEERQG